mmetsp:Transcript_25101/g.28059  ORF Transcript_25101/g.28059 Transcript_25101/m.28059 type:complete len:167 (+) Transcript_25101:148-648(+)
MMFGGSRVANDEGLCSVSTTSSTRGGDDNTVYNKASESMSEGDDDDDGEEEGYSEEEDEEIEDEDEATDDEDEDEDEDENDDEEEYDDTKRKTKNKQKRRDKSSRSSDSIFERLGEIGIDILNETIVHAERAIPSPRRTNRRNINQGGTIINTFVDLFSCGSSSRY